MSIHVVYFSNYIINTYNPVLSLLNIIYKLRLFKYNLIMFNSYVHKILVKKIKQNSFKLELYLKGLSNYER